MVKIFFSTIKIVSIIFHLSKNTGRDTDSNTSLIVS